MLHLRTVMVVLGMVSMFVVACASPTGMLLMSPIMIPEYSENVASSSQSGPFTRMPADLESPSGHSVVKDCQIPSADYPYQPYDWPDASATLDLRQAGGRSTVAIEINDARPNTYFTVWLRLKGEDANGVAFGGSPLTGRGGTPLAPTSELGNLLAATGPENGNDRNANGFYTDENGDAIFKTDLDFAIINGACPFQKFEGFDPTDERYPIENPKNIPVAIVGAGGPFTFRVVSHCTDSIGHGLEPGPREGWFQWKYTP